MNKVNFKVNNKLLDKIDDLKKELDRKRPLSKLTLYSLKESTNLEWIYHSNGIEGEYINFKRN